MTESPPDDLSKALNDLDGVVAEAVRVGNIIVLPQSMEPTAPTAAWLHRSVRSPVRRLLGWSCILLRMRMINASEPKDRCCRRLCGKRHPRRRKECDDGHSRADD